jgi:hypothetical protein
MPRALPTSSERRASRVLLWGAAVLFSAASAWAATFQHVAEHVTQKSPTHVWKVLTAYDETCASGCKYSRPSLVKVVKLSHEASATRWYTWSHVSSAVKDAKYFTEVTLAQKSNGHFTTENRQLDGSDKALIERLEGKTGLKHAPIFDGGSTKTVTESRGEQTVVKQIVTLETGAVIGLWAGKIREEMAKNVSATFQNIEK